MGKARKLLLILSLLSAITLVGCAPGLRPYSNAFISGPTASIPVSQYNSPHSSGPTLQEVAAQLSYGPWSRESVHPTFSKSIANVYTGQVEWDDAQKIYRVPVQITLSESNKETVLSFWIPFKTAPRKEPVEVADTTDTYRLAMICASEECNEKIFRLKRRSDGATALIKNLRAEEVLIPADGKGDGIPIVQHYMEVKEGQTRRHIIDREGSARELEPYLKNPDLLKGTKFRRAIDVPVLTDKEAPGISQKTIGQKLVWIGELMIRNNTRIPQNACNRFLLFILAASGYQITSEPEAHNFLNLLIDPQFKGWRIEGFRFVNSKQNEQYKLAQRLDRLPERRGVILQYGKGNKKHGHVAVLFREGNRFFVMDSSMNGHAPKKSVRGVNSLLNASRPQLNIMFPPDVP